MQRPGASSLPFSYSIPIHFWLSLNASTKQSPSNKGNLCLSTLKAWNKRKKCGVVFSATWRTNQVISGDHSQLLKNFDFKTDLFLMGNIINALGIGCPVRRLHLLPPSSTSTLLITLTLSLTEARRCSLLLADSFFLVWSSAFGARLSLTPRTVGDDFCPVGKPMNTFCDALYYRLIRQISSFKFYLADKIPQKWSSKMMAFVSSTVKHQKLHVNVKKLL